jgi:type II secretory pathway component HofQ
MTTTGLFDDLPEAEARRQAETNAAAVRVSRPARDQLVGRWLISTSWYRRIIRFGWW